MINTFQLIPESEKGFGYIKKIAFDIIAEAQSSFNTEVAELQKLWDVYNGNFNEKDFEYLTSVDNDDDDLSYPAKVRDIASQLVRSMLNVLESEQARRKPRFKASVCDERSQKQKYEERLKTILDAIESSVEDRYAEVTSVIQSVNDQLSDLEKQLEVDPENEELVAKSNALRANMPSIRLEFGKMLRSLDREGVDLNNISEKIKYFRQFSEVELIEVIANAVIKSKLRDPDAREDFDKGLKEKLVTGHPMYFVNYNEKKKKVDFTNISSLNSGYSKSGNNRWTQNGEWCCLHEFMSLTSIVAEFDLSVQETNQINHYLGGDYNYMYSHNYNVAVFSPNDNKERLSGGIPVWRVWWLSPREWWWKKTPNKHRPGEYFNHVITDIKKARINKDDIVSREILYDRYSAVIIGNVLCKTNGVDLNVIRYKDAPAMPLLPIVARTHILDSDKAYSLIQRTKDLRELYNIIFYSLELNIVLSGVRGMIMDKSQKPDDMSTEKWMYYRRIGTMWIETMKKGRKVPATFNQFQNYDDTLSQSISIIFEILAGIESLMSKIMGITAPRTGQTVAKDPVHNVMMSQEQSSLITEIQFYESDLVYSQAISMYLNLYFQYEAKEGKVINYLDENIQEVLFRIPNGIMGKSDFSISAWNNIQEDHMLDILRQQAAATISIDGLASLYRIDSLTEMEKRLTQIIVDQENRKTQSAMSVDNNKAQNDQKTAQMKAELDGYSTNLKMQLENAKLELEKIKVDSDLQFKQWDMKIKEAEIQSKSDLKLLEVSSENEIESAYLKETMRSNAAQEALELNRQRIESILAVGNMAVSKEQGDKKNEVDLKKAELAATKRKNNIKD